MRTIVIPAAERGIKDIGWLKSHFSFSFSSYANPSRNGFGLLRTLNDDTVQPKGGFGIHPHNNMEIISVMLQGKMNHKDTMGYTEVVEKDWVQIMSAGSGLRHEEHNVGDEEVQFLQIWIEPKLQNIAPRYQKRYFPLSERKNALTTIVSNEEGVKHCWINQNAKLSLGHLEAGNAVHYEWKPLNKAIYVYAIKGGIKVADTFLNEKDGLGVWETTSVDISAEQEAEFIVIEIPINH